MLFSRHLLTHIEGPHEAEGMLFRYVATLAASAGMTLCTCFTIFKWENVKSDAGHGTMFMVFFFWAIWSIATLCRTILVYMNGREDSLENDSIRQVSFVTEVSFNAVSMWFVVAAYEFQRRALAPRNDSGHRTSLTCYMLLIGGLTLGTLVYLIVIEYHGEEVLSTDMNSPNIVIPRSAAILVKISWVSWSVRCLAVAYPATVSLWLYLRRDHLKLHGLPRALSLIVAFFFILNTPYLVVDPLFDYDVIKYSEDKGMKLLGLMRTLSYFSGVAISFVMGFTVRGFDTFYNARRSSLTQKPHFEVSLSRSSLFVLSDHSR